MRVLVMKWIRKSVNFFRWLSDHLHGLCRSLLVKHFYWLVGTPAEPYRQIFYITDSQKLPWKHGGLFLYVNRTYFWGSGSTNPNSPPFSNSSISWRACRCLLFPVESISGSKKLLARIMN
jgi:hypothetical protein